MCENSTKQNYKNTPLMQKENTVPIFPTIGRTGS